LDKDFEIINMFVPPYQLVDTVNIFRKENSRKISLRFLANYLLGRDMQQDTHDSVEDAKIAYEIYLIALRLISQGRFNQVLDDIYEYGRRNEWRLGLDD
jgi:PAB-dependent poly(A)-specific ribonuclease subunit 2